MQDLIQKGNHKDMRPLSNLLTSLRLEFDNLQLQTMRKFQLEQVSKFLKAKQSLLSATSRLVESDQAATALEHARAMSELCHNQEIDLNKLDRKLNHPPKFSEKYSSEVLQLSRVKIIISISHHID